LDARNSGLLAGPTTAAHTIMPVCFLAVRHTGEAGWQCGECYAQSINTVVLTPRAGGAVAQQPAETGSALTEACIIKSSTRYLYSIHHCCLMLMMPFSSGCGSLRICARKCSTQYCEPPICVSSSSSSCTSLAA
jgi:hypothetical protein